MDNENHKNTWNNFTKFVCGELSLLYCFSFNGNILIIEIFHENWVYIRKFRIEKRIAITPEIVKKYIDLGFEVLY